MALLEGVKVDLGGKSFIIPPLNMKSLRILGPKFTALQAALAGGAMSLDNETIDTLVDTIHSAMIRNYPSITRDEIEDLVDLGSLPQVFQAVMAQSVGKSGNVEAPKEQ